tara:strand:+ start:3940 stop:4146 length:207 start_codon:yes stop_codon:yes gene_type:complete
MYKENKQLIHRLEMVQDDVKALLEHLEDGKSMKHQTNYADDGYTHLNNIYIALDMNDNECLEWKKFNK